MLYFNEETGEWYTLDDDTPLDASGDPIIPSDLAPTSIGSSNWLEGIKSLLSGKSSTGVAGQMLGLGGMAALLNSMLGGGGSSGYAGYKGGIPKYTASRQMLPIPQTVTSPEGQAVPRRPGSGGVSYFSPMMYTPAPPTPTAAPVSAPVTDPVIPANGAAGGLTSLAAGGRFLRGSGDGVSDSIPARFAETNKPARLADGEFVLDARTVSEIGNGSSEAGARKLYAFMKAVHGARKRAGRGSNSGADKHLNKLLG